MDHVQVVGSNGIAEYLTADDFDSERSLDCSSCLDLQEHIPNIWRGDCYDRFAPECWKNILFKPTDDNGSMTAGPDSLILFKPLASYQLERGFGVHDFGFLRSLFCFPRVLTNCEKDSGLLSPLPCNGQGKIWIATQGKRLLFSIEAILESPQLAAG